MSRILFEEKVESEQCLIEWRQIVHSGENQDVWAIDDITIRDVISKKSIKKITPVKYVRTSHWMDF